MILCINIIIKRDIFISCLITMIGLITTIISSIYLQFYTKIQFLHNNLFLYNNFYCFYTMILIIISIITCLIVFSWLKNLPYNKDEFYLLILIISLGGMINSYANNFIVFFIGFELISIPFIGLIIYNMCYKKSMEASIKYLVLSSIASAFLILGIALIYIDCGTLNFTYIKYYILHNLNNQNIHLYIIGLSFLLFSLGFKLSVVPFHLWTPDIYEGSPSLISMFLSTFSKSTFLICLYKLLIFFNLTEINKLIISNILLSISVLSILFGNLMAIKQNNIKRLLGYASIAHIGYILIIFIYHIKYPQNTFLTLTALSIYIISYILNNIGVFSIIYLHSYPNNINDKDCLYNYRGLFWYKPLYTFVLTVMLLSLAGLPITIGFIAKFYIILLGIYIKLWYLVICLILGSVISLYYYLRIIITLYLEPSTLYVTNCNIQQNNILYINTILVLITVCTLLLGIYPTCIIQMVYKVLNYHI
ncbi:NADH-quinone oxidoreductase subunit N [Enterobacteriaceae endosymbiont of Macroplea appendiculata]|uniref:NADH-quinone oxidoreductase subunit N n=1 Tax=Enterobacteriaceae endosymbiont of Macroplea appendiculata TaxID=2675790 RepID=UPI00145782F3|nr:NADH-quinone oxidoreductase subunit N [Enterobacteriaceae endosymbiont of Macroplea appendiculata]